MSILNFFVVSSILIQFIPINSLEGNQCNGNICEYKPNQDTADTVHQNPHIQTLHTLPIERSELAEIPLDGFECNGNVCEYKPNQDTDTLHQNPHIQTLHTLPIERSELAEIPLDGFECNGNVCEYKPNQDTADTVHQNPHMKTPQEITENVEVSETEHSTSIEGNLQTSSQSSQSFQHSEASKSSEIEVLIFPNGGNNTGANEDQPLWFSVRKDPNLESLFDLKKLAISMLLKDSQTQEADLFDWFGRKVSSAKELNHQMSYYLVPTTDFFVWPGVKIGHSIPLLEVTPPTGIEQLRLQTMSLQPRAFKIENFLSEEECEWLKEHAKPQMVRSTILDHGFSTDDRRTSSTAWLGKEDGDVIRKIDERCSQLSHVPILSRLEEPIQVIHYNVGQKYVAHMDNNDPHWHPEDENAVAGVHRLLTIFFYLNDVEEGGETVFPYSVPDGFPLMEPFDFSDCSRGLKVKPKRGSAIMWYSLTAKGHMKGELDYYSLHTGCPPLKGEKWAANKWISNRHMVSGKHAYKDWTDDQLFGTEPPPKY